MKTMTYSNTFFGFGRFSTAEVFNRLEAIRLIEKWNKNSEDFCKGIYRYELVMVE